MKQEMLCVKPWHPIIQLCKYVCKMVELGKWERAQQIFTNGRCWAQWHHRTVWHWSNCQLERQCPHGTLTWSQASSMAPPESRPACNSSYPKLSALRCSSSVFPCLVVLVFLSAIATFTFREGHPIVHCKSNLQQWLPFDEHFYNINFIAPMFSMHVVCDHMSWGSSLTQRDFWSRVGCFAYNNFHVR